MSEKVSIAIPCYEMSGRGVDFLHFNLERIAKQDYKDIQVVISDHSSDSRLAECIFAWVNFIDIKYIENKEYRGSSSHNLNNAINNCDGEIIKILFQDDFLLHEKSISDIVEAFTDDYQWLASGCTHTKDGTSFFNNMWPVWNSRIIYGQNSISSPSVISIRKSVTERFDENLIWMMDCEMYYRLWKKYGRFKSLNSFNVANRLWGNRLSDIIPEATKEKEIHSVIKKHNL